MQNEKIYKLHANGRSYNAAINASKGAEQLAREFQSVPETAQDYVEMIQQLRENVVEDMTVSFGLAGQTSPVIQIEQDDNAVYPRAYKHLPKVYALPPVGESKEYDLYMFCPIGHDGRHFTPEDASLIDNTQETENIKIRKNYGGVSLLNMLKRATEVPKEYTGAQMKPQKDKYFIMQESTVEKVESCTTKREEYKQNIMELRKKIKNFIEEKLGDKIRQQIGGDGFYLSGSQSFPERPNEKPSFSFSLHQSGEIDPRKESQIIDFPENPYFTTQQEFQGGEHIIIPGEDTEEGVYLKALIDAAPPSVSLYNDPDLYPEFMKENSAIAISTRTLGAAKILVYTNLGEDNNFCPPDSVPMSAGTYQWLLQDRLDGENGIIPPPAPQDVIDELARIDSALTPKKDIEDMKNAAWENSGFNFDL